MKVIDVLEIFEDFGNLDARSQEGSKCLISLRSLATAALRSPERLPRVVSCGRNFVNWVEEKLAIS